MSKKILLIDDDVINTRLIQSRLEEEGFDVYTAPDGEAGLVKAESERPDIIILDVEMPKMNGYTFMHKIKAREEIKSIPVVVLSSHAEMQPIFQLKGVKGYLVKPVDFAKMFELIEKVVGAES